MNLLLNYQQEAAAAETWMYRQFDTFIDGLTARQLDAFEAKGVVPKGEAHQRRWANYKHAEREWTVVQNRANFRLVV